MAKTYTLDGPILLENLSAQAALGFSAAVINAVPAYSMGSATLNIKAQGPAGQTTCVTGKTVDELKASLAKAKTGTPADITYDVRGRVNLVGLSLEDGIQVIEAAMNAIPTDSLVVTGMVAQMET